MTKEERAAIRTAFHLHPVYSEHCGKNADDFNVHCTNHKDVDCPVCRKNIDHLTLQSGDNFTFNFGRVKFVDNNAIINQIDHISSEVKEAFESATTPDKHHTALELMDVLHSAETALRIMAEFHGINLNEIRKDCAAKNKVRGYYDAT